MIDGLMYSPARTGVAVVIVAECSIEPETRISSVLPPGIDTAGVGQAGTSSQT